MSTVKRGKILRKDFATWDGKTATASRVDATGGTISGLVIGDEVDVLQTYGAGENRTLGSITNAIQRIGTSNVTLMISPGTWTIDSDLTIPSNFSVYVKAGAVFNISAGMTLTFSGPLITESETFTSGSGSVSLPARYIYGGKQSFSVTSTETANSVTPTDTTVPAYEHIELSRRYGYTWSRDKDEHLFEYHLSRYGAVFDGSTDDQAAIQNAIDAMESSGRQKRYKFPSGNLTARIDTGLTIQTGVSSIDFGGLIIDASNMTSGYAVALTSYASSPFNVDSHSAPLSNLILVGPTSEANSTDAVSIIGSVGSYNAADIGIYNWTIKNFRDGVYIGDYAYIIHFYNCNLYNAYRYGLNVYASTTAGENISFFGGAVANVEHSAGSGVGIYMQDSDNGNNEVYMHSTSLDYCDQIANIQGGTLSLHGCHIEDNHSSNALINIAHNSGNVPSGLIMDGGKIALTDATARTSWVTIDGSKAFCKLRTTLDTYNLPSEIITATSGAFVSLAGSIMDFAGASVANYPSPGSALNRIGNAGFEAGALTGWTSSGTGHTFTADGAGQDTGTWAAKCVATGANNGSIYQVHSVRPGEQVTARFRVDVDALTAGSVATIVWFYNDSSLALVVETNTVTSWSSTTSGYVTSVQMYEVPAGANYARVGIIDTGFTGTYYLDNVELHTI